MNAVLVEANGDFGVTQCNVAKFETSIMSISPLFGNIDSKPTIIKLSSVFLLGEHIATPAGTMDIVAVNELRLTRKSRERLAGGG